MLKIVVDIRNKRLLCRRDIYSLLHRFEAPDWELLFRQQDVHHLNRYGKLCLNLKNLRLVSSPQVNKSDCVLLTDGYGQGEWKKKIRVRYDIFFNPEVTQRNALNYSEHPTITSNYSEEKVSRFRNLPKRMDLLFAAGNLDPHLYSSPVLKDVFGMEPRYRLYSRLLGEGNACLVRDQGHFETVNEWTGIVIRSFSSDSWKWLEHLAASRFYITPPGVIMPMCHNLIEAMCVGTVPITAYPHLFWPRLKHGVNCLAYSGFDQLLTRIKEARRMPPEAYSAMRSAALEYYERHLRPDSNIDRVKALIDSPGRIEELYFIAEHVSVYRLPWKYRIRLINGGLAAKVLRRVAKVLGKIGRRAKDR